MNVIVQARGGVKVIRGDMPWFQIPDRNSAYDTADVFFSNVHELKEFSKSLAKQIADLES